MRERPDCFVEAWDLVDRVLKGDFRCGLIFVVVAAGDSVALDRQGLQILQFAVEAVIQLAELSDLGRVGLWDIASTSGREFRTA